MSTIAAWLLIFRFVFVPLIRKRHRKELTALGIPTCIACGYDLRGLIGSRCPECGRE
jgi:predicted Zn-ribbon and HTH transcriptional regulator